ncbi:uncharacterized protein LOC143857634 [Tasmannia lanceolata]|uniref:uncharacterized protein LOC143857634 n=1 Tax=Tasmannia lanceolata TaxID=3420 RepID=UPI004062A5CA
MRSSFASFFSNFYTTSLFFFSTLLLQLVLIIKSVARNLGSSRNPPENRNLALVAGKHPIIRYENRTGLEFAECAVCISKLEEGDEVRELQCKHLFHKDCLDRWVEYKLATCPLCRSFMLPEETLIEQLRSEREYEDEDLVLMFLAFHGSNLHRLMWFR